MTSIWTRVVAGAVVAVIAGCGPTSNSTQSTSAGAPSAPAAPAEVSELAAADGFAQPTQATLARYDSALDRAAALCEQGRPGVSAMAIRGAQLAAEDGISLTAMGALEGIVAAVPDDLAPMDCAEIISAIIVLSQ